MDIEPTPFRSVNQRIGDPRVRAEIPLAVLARPQDDAVAGAVWRAVAQALEATSHAVACGQDGTDPSATAVLTRLAQVDTEYALSLLTAQGECDGARLLRGRVPRQSPGAAPVERTWLRLAGVLLGPVPADPRALAACLADHGAALAAWRQVLLAPLRLRRLQLV